MKKSSLVLVALLLTAPVFANEVQPLTLASADTSASVNLQTTESSDLGARLDKEVKEVSDVLSAKIASDLAAKIAQEVVASVKF